MSATVLATVLDSTYALEAWDFTLPPELIAKEPVYPKESARLLVLSRAKKTIREATVGDLGDIVGPDVDLILNQTKVFPARLYGKRASGGHAEVLLVRKLGPLQWLSMVRPGKKLEGKKIFFKNGIEAFVGEKTKQDLYTLTFSSEEGLFEIAAVPLPPYIKESKATLDDYQCCYAKETGSCAAPTAGLHLSPEMLAQFDAHFVTLHIGLGTFQPIVTQDLRHHEMHEEFFTITTETAHAINTSKKRRLAVGTTTARTLESSHHGQTIIPQNGSTCLFIYPPYEITTFDMLLTNFHLPRSSLLMLVAAFCGKDFLFEAYALALAKRFRFYSFGDAMLIV